MVAASALLAHASASGSVFFGPSPYLCIEDSPFDISGLGTSFFLENIKDGLVNSPGGITDSVDCDDGIIDNNGVNGRSLFNNGATGVLATFNAGILGGYALQIVSETGCGTLRDCRAAAAMCF
jgi:hypothetical protein